MGINSAHSSLVAKNVQRVRRVSVLFWCDVRLRRRLHIQNFIGISILMFLARGEAFICPILTHRVTTDDTRFIFSYRRDSL
jgi:hypothetical protein